MSLRPVACFAFAALAGACSGPASSSSDSSWPAPDATVGVAADAAMRPDASAPEPALDAGEGVDSGLAPDAGLARDSGAPPDAQLADSGPGPADASQPDAGPPPPVTATQGAALWTLDNSFVTTKAHADGTLEVAREGQAPFVMARDPDDLDVVCILLRGAYRCDGAGPLPAYGPGDARAITQSTATRATETCVHTLFSGLAVDDGGVKTFTAIDLAWDVCLSPGSDEVVVRLSTAGESYGLDLDTLFFPYAPAQDPRGAGYAVLPFAHGMLLPVGWLVPSPVWTHLESGVPIFEGVWEGDSTGWQMPFYGVVEEDGRALLIEARTDAHTSFHVRQPLGAPARVTPAHRSALDLFEDGGTRELAYVPFSNADYTRLTSRYRARAIATGRHVPLTAKMQAHPAVDRLIGGAQITSTSCYYDEPSHTMYSYDSFASVWSKVDAAANAPTDPITRGIVHLDGWGQRGYDNLHPDVVLASAACVPSPDGTADCGPCDPGGTGWTGFAQLASHLATADARHAFVFEPHDNYFDLYVDAPSYSGGEDAIRDYTGGVPAPWSNWAGGPQELLCPARALGYLQRNLDLLASHSVVPGSYYLDVFSAAGPGQCYGKNLVDHRVHRPDSLAFRAGLFDELHSRGVLTASEQASDWALSHLDHVYWSHYQRLHDPGSTDPRRRSSATSIGPMVGVPVPLLELVYHDAIVVPWPVLQSERGEVLLDAPQAVGIPIADLGSLANDRARRELGRVMALHRALGTTAMDTHRFLDDRYNAQEARFGAATVSTDRNALSVSVSGAPGIPASWVPEPHVAVAPQIASTSAVSATALQVSLGWTVTESLSGFPAQSVFLHAVRPDGSIVANGDPELQHHRHVRSRGGAVPAGRARLSAAGPAHLARRSGGEGGDGDGHLLEHQRRLSSGRRDAARAGAADGRPGGGGHDRVVGRAAAARGTGGLPPRARRERDDPPQRRLLAVAPLGAVAVPGATARAAAAHPVQRRRGPRQLPSGDRPVLPGERAARGLRQLEQRAGAGAGYAHAPGLGREDQRGALLPARVLRLSLMRGATPGF